MSALTNHLHERLRQMVGIEFAPGIGLCQCTKGYGIVAFKLSNVNSADLAAFLDSENIFVRSGDHCLSAPKREEDYIRVSLQIYNTFSEIDRFIKTIDKAFNDG